jgi:hypothetical protein
MAVPGPLLSYTPMRSLWSTLVLGSGLVAAAACSNDSTGPGHPNGTCSGTTFSLASLEGRVIAAEDLPCLTIPADGGTYVVVPQFPTASATLAPVNFTLTAGSGSAATARIVPVARRVLPPTALRVDLGRAQRNLDGFLRRREHEVAAAARSAPPSARGPLANRVQADVVLQSPRPFHVLSDFSNNDTFKTDTAILKYTGAHIAIYQSQNAPAPPNGFTDAEIAAFGNTFDQDLYQIDVQTFGSATDIDNNGHVIVLMSPIINHLTTANTCNTQGFIAGFFDAIDLLPTQFTNSNDGEIFYTLVPDPAGTFSCAHSKDATGELTTSTFIHEFQHMISFGQHAIIRDGNEEDSWLNEGLSHIAEELGSRYYENKFPPPTGRTDADQVFPDSSQGFISGDLYNSWHFLFDPTSTDTTDKASVSNWGNGDGTLVQRGGSWLFLRWLGDQQDSTVYGRLDQTSLTGVPNVEAASGSSFQTLFGEFALALYVDSLPGVARSSIPSEFRFTSRNLRALYGKEFERNPGTFTVEFPIESKSLAPGSTRSSSMYPGTMDFYVLNAPGSGNPVVLTFAPASGSTFNSSLHAQVSVFHCPSASACQ